MENKEPSNQTLLESMNERFNMLSYQMEKHDRMLGFVSHQLGTLLQGQLSLEKQITESWES